MGILGTTWSCWEKLFFVLFTSYHIAIAYFTPLPGTPPAKYYLNQVFAGKLW